MPISLSHLVLLILILYLINKIYALYIYVKNYIIVQKLPGPPRGGIIMGNIAGFGNTAEAAFENTLKISKEFYPIFSVHAVHLTSVFVLSPDDCELILSNPIHNEKGFMYKLIHKWLRFGLLTSFGTKWQTRRKILTPAFHFSILQQFVSVFNEQAEQLIEILSAECNKSYIKVNSVLTQFTLKTISETAMGTKLEFKNKKDQAYKKAIYDIGEILAYRFIHPWCMAEIGNLLFNSSFFKERKAVNILHQFTREVIEEKEKNFVDTDLPKEEHDVYKGKRKLAMLDLLLSAKKNGRIIDNEGIREEVDTFMFEGHDTITTALSFMLMLLANNKDVQERIYSELVEIFGENFNENPTYNELQNLKYLERCIKESLRLYPSVFFMARNLGEDLKTASGYLLPKGTQVVMYIYPMHRNPDLYPDPDKFDPDRFLPENCQHRHPYAYIPFSAGSRNCIGQKFAILEMKVVLCAILRKFFLEPVDTPQSIVLIIDIILRTKDEIKVKFVPRD
ncbi:cytochrome P450 4c3-like [Zophobas morio]|uniref:cytochrome P450 4c3-like n=1 Tax=Zophobas morio TaxID=2755281 RepID=UPI0030831D9D